MLFIATVAVICVNNTRRTVLCSTVSASGSSCWQRQNTKKMSFLCGCCCACKQEETDGGQPISHDPDFKGPVSARKRYPKDVLCLILFIAFICGMVGIGVYGWIKGDPNRLLYSVDSNGRLCGRDAAVQDRPNLLFFDLTKCVRKLDFTAIASGTFEASDLFSCPTQQVCVSQCPTVNEVGIRANPICVEGVNTTQFNILAANDTVANAIEKAQAATTLIQLIAEERCAPYYIISTAVANRCIPTFANLSELVNLDNFTSFNTSMVPNLGDVITSVSLSTILDGTLTQAIVLNVQLFVFNVYRDVEVVWPALLIGAGISILICYLYVFLMRYFAGVIVWIGIILALIIVLAVSGFAFFQFYCFQSGNNAIPNFFSNNNLTSITDLQSFLNSTEQIAAAGCQFTNPLRDFFASNAPWFQYQKETWLAGGIVFLVIFLVILIAIILLGKKIRISTQIIKEAAKAVAYIPGVMFYPLVTWLLIILVVGYWGVAAVFLFTSSEPQYTISISDDLINVTTPDGVNYTRGDLCNIQTFPGTAGDNNTMMVMDTQTMMNVTVSCLFYRFFTSNLLIGLQVYLLFGMLWLSNYVIALGECTIAGSFASYYWARNKWKDIPLLTTPASFARAVIFHSGSLAFGALIIAIIQLIRIILAYIQKKLKKSESKIVKGILVCMQCCFYLLEKVLRYINRQAYIEIAIYGHDFCTAACKVVKLLLRNVITTAVKDRIVSFLLFLGKLAIVGVMAVFGYLAFGAFEEQVRRVIWMRELNYYLLPLMILILLTYLIATGFTDVYHVGVDTIYISALEDMERNNGSDKPYFMSKSLQSLLGVKNRKDATDGGEDGIAMEDVH